jgi:MarR family transcriptional regulator, organic hydroperoxide resistance regulator
MIIAKVSLGSDQLYSLGRLGGAEGSLQAFPCNDEVWGGRAAPDPTPKYQEGSTMTAAHPQPETLALQNQLCFALYAASRAMTNIYRPLLDDLGVTYPQYLVLIVLWEHEPQTVKNLGNLLYLDSGTLSPLLKRLEAAGLITRTRDVEDERAVKVGLTATGRDLKARVVSFPDQIEQKVGLPADDFATLHTLLQQVIVNLTTPDDDPQE